MCAPLLIFLALAASAGQASEPKSRIRYAEPIQIQASNLPGSAGIQSARTPALLRFDAYGRRFELELESNDRLLRRLSSARRAELPPHDLYRGRLTGLPGSWVRLTRLPDGIYGAVWDGSEFYSIAPAHTLAEFMGGATPATSDQPLIYRASDVDMLGGPRFCAVFDPTGGSGKPITGLDQYKSLLRELPRNATAAAVATLELEVAMIADFEFFSAEVDPASALLNRLNVVDGIFSEQVGVAITATELKVFDDPADPFTTSDAGTLLDQVGRYRKVTPAIAATGLAHLVTGRNLTARDPQNNVDDSIVGIAYLFGVCEAEIGVSVSERLDPFISALVAAHEFGHNLGAPHDDEAGSPCQSAPSGFLMEATLNGSSRFTQCSLDQMAPIVAASSCIRPRQYVDVAVELAATRFQGHARVPVPLVFHVVNRGSRTADHSEITVTTPTSAIALEPVNVEGGSCTSGNGSITCQIDAMPAGARRRIEIDATYSSPWTYFGTVAVTAANDVNSENDSADFEVNLLPATIASVSASAPVQLNTLKGEEFELTYEVRVTGVLPLQDAVSGSSLPFSSMTLISASAEGGNCTLSGSVVSCSFGEIANGDSRRVTLRLRADRVGNYEVGHSVSGLIDDTHQDVVSAHQVKINPLVDLVVRPENGPLTILKGSTYSVAFTVLSVGPRPARLVRVTLQGMYTVHVSSLDIEGGVCEPDNSQSSFNCRFNLPIESGGTRRIDMTLLAAKAGQHQLRAHVSSPDNEHLDGPLSTSAGIDVDIRDLADVRIDDTSQSLGHDNRPLILDRTVASIGLSAAEGVELVADLPTGVRALQATSNSGSCVVVERSVRCSLGVLEPNEVAGARIVVEADAPGRFAVSIRVGASNDAEPANNQTSTELAISPNIDVSVGAMPDAVRVKLGRTSRVAISIRTASQPVTNVGVILSGYLVDMVDATTSSGMCGEVSEWSNNAILCTVGTMPSNAIVTLEAEFRGREDGEGFVSASVGGEFDIDFENNQGQSRVLIAPVGNARVSAPPQGSALRVGETFQAAGFSVLALADTDAVGLRFSVPPGLAIEAGIPNVGECEVAPGIVDCAFGNLLTGESRTVDLRLRAEQAGTFTTRAELVTDDDSDPSDNSATLRVQVEGGTAPPPSSSGGGGGGSLDWATFMLGALSVALRCRRRQRAAGTRGPQVHSGRCSAGPAH